MTEEKKGELKQLLNEKKKLSEETKEHQEKKKRNF